jgi:V8-like Glu-specific endopeptidase
MFIVQTRIILAAAILCGLSGSALAVGGDNVGNDDRKYVGRIMREGSNAGSGTLIQPNNEYRPWVLTAGHVLNSQTRESTNKKIYIRQRFERFKDNNDKIIFGLGVQHPTFAGQADGSSYGPTIKDVGLLLLLNGPDAADFGTGTLGLADADYPGEGGGATIAGFANNFDQKFAKKAPVKLKVAADLGAETITWQKQANFGYIQPGDSGGPTFNPDGKIIGVHSYSIHDGETPSDSNLTASVDMRVNANAQFLRGDGVGDAGSEVGRLNRYIGAAGAAEPYQWESEGDSGIWKRGTTASEKKAPKNNDVAVIDPTKGDDKAGHTIEIKNASTADLEGLLTDVTIKVTNDKALRVTGRTGALNGGVIEVGGDSKGKIDIRHAIENRGTITLKDQATAEIGRDVPSLADNDGNHYLANINDVLWNGPGATISVGPGATLTTAMSAAGEARTRITNDGTDTVKGVFKVEGAEGKPAKVDADFFASSGDLTIKTNAKLTLGAKTRRSYTGGDSPEVFSNDGKGIVTVGSGGKVVADNTGPDTSQPNSGVFGSSWVRNGSATAADARIVVEDGGSFECNRFSNLKGSVKVNSGGEFKASRPFENGGVAGSTLYTSSVELAGTMTTGGLVNYGWQNGGSTFQVKKTGSLTAQKTVLAGGEDAETFTNSQKATLEIQPGGKVTLSGQGSNRGTIKVGADNADAALLTFKKGIEVPGDGTLFFPPRDPNAPPGTPPPPPVYTQIPARRSFTNDAGGVIEFTSGTKKAEWKMEDVDFTDKGVIKGEHTLTITKATAFKMEAKSADLEALDLRAMSVVFDAAKPAGGNNATFESASLDKGAAGYADGAFLSRFALDSMSLKNNSEVGLLDAFEKNDPHAQDDPLREVLYVKNFGIEQGSILDLGGGTLYFVNKLLDYGDPFAGGRYRNGTVKQIPTPGCIALGCLSLLIVAARRRG